MARTWTLTELLSGYRPSLEGWMCQPDSFDVVYYIDYSHTKIYSWGGVGTIADISGSTFTTNFELWGICWFKDELYVLAEHADGGDWNLEVWKWSGSGQTWNEQWNGSAENVEIYNTTTTPSAPAVRMGFDADQNYMVIDAAFARDLGGGDATKRRWISSDGSNWSSLAIGGVYGGAVGVFGISSGSKYPRIFLRISDPSDASGVGVAIRDFGLATFTYQGDVYDANLNEIIGYIYDYLIQLYVTTGYPVHYSDNWGVVSSATSGFAQGSSGPNPRAFHLGDDAAMICTGSDEDAYVWDDNTTQFVADGSIPDANRFIRGFFRLGTTLYALCAYTTGTTGYVYEGGLITNVFDPYEAVANNNEFYYGIESLAKTCNLSFGVKPKGMAINPDTSDVVVVSDTAQTTMSERMLKDENYATANDYSDGLATDEDIDAVEYI